MRRCECVCCESARAAVQLQAARALCMVTTSTCLGLGLELESGCPSSAVGAAASAAVGGALMIRDRVADPAHGCLPAVLRLLYSYSDSTCRCSRCTARTCSTVQYAMALQFGVDSIRRCTALQCIRHGTRYGTYNNLRQHGMILLLQRAFAQTQAAAERHRSACFLGCVLRVEFNKHRSRLCVAS
jgi:hypothetical protein